jgi:type VI secretion system protein ImpF
MPIATSGTYSVASLLDRLLDDDPRAGDPCMDTLDLKEPAKLLAKLTGAGNGLLRYLKEQFLPEERALLERTNTDAPPANDILIALTDGLNRVILGPLLYEPKRFEGVKLSAATVRLMEDSRKTTHIAILNRCLLDEIFSDELLKMRPAAPSTASVRELKNAVSRDIESLLNTRRELQEGAPPEYIEVNNSLLMFGLPDFTSFSLLNSRDTRRICRAVEEALSKFEPRLKSVRVSLQPTQQFDPALHFRIDALLRMDPVTTPVTFDAALQISTCAYRVRGET